MRRRSQLLAIIKKDDDEDELEDGPGSKTLFNMILAFTHVPCVPVDAISYFIKSQTHLSTQQSKELGKNIMSVQLEQAPSRSPQHPKPEAATEKGVDFPGFLRLMSWMICFLSGT